MIIRKTDGLAKEFIDEEGIIKGIGSVFGNVDSDGDIMVKGAYTKTLKENGDRVAFLWQHNMKDAFATYESLEEKESSLDYVIKVPMTSASAADKYHLIKAGVVKENSVGFQPIREQKSANGGHNEILEVKLYEISAVTRASNPLALVEMVKAAKTQEQLDAVRQDITKRFDAIAKLLSKGNITNELGYLMEYELKSLQTLALANFTEPLQKHSADEEAKKKAISNYNYILGKF